MTTLNSRLQLAMINRKKSRNALEKGFTLVELMIVIVIVGILSAVALPNFLNQTTKAKTTEAKSLSSAYLKQYHAESMIGSDEATAFMASGCPAETDNFTFDCSTAGEITATGQDGLSGTLVMAVDSAGKITETNNITSGGEEEEEEE